MSLMYKIFSTAALQQNAGLSDPGQIEQMQPDELFLVKKFDDTAGNDLSTWALGTRVQDGTNGWVKDTHLTRNGLTQG